MSEVPSHSVVKAGASKVTGFAAVTGQRLRNEAIRSARTVLSTLSGRRQDQEIDPATVDPFDPSHISKKK